MGEAVNLTEVRLLGDHRRTKFKNAPGLPSVLFIVLKNMR